MESILSSVKKHLGVDTSECEVFDTEIIDGINTTFSVLNQLGIGPKDGFMISGTEEVWTDFLPSGVLQNLVRQYVFLRVKQIFDPSTSANVSDAIDNRIDELEFRIRMQVEILDEISEEEIADDVSGE